MFPSARPVAICQGRIHHFLSLFLACPVFHVLSLGELRALACLVYRHCALLPLQIRTPLWCALKSNHAQAAIRHTLQLIRNHYEDYCL